MADSSLHMFRASSPRCLSRCIPILDKEVATGTFRRLEGPSIQQPNWSEWIQMELYIIILYYIIVFYHTGSQEDPGTCSKADISRQSFPGRAAQNRIVPPTPNPYSQKGTMVLGRVARDSWVKCLVSALQSFPLRLFMILHAACQLQSLWLQCRCKRCKRCQPGLGLRA